MDAHIENHLPLITARLIFAPKVFAPPPPITLRMDFPSLVLEPQDHSPAPESKRATPPVRHATTPARTTVPKRVRISSTPHGTSSGHSTTDEDMEIESVGSQTDNDELMEDDKDVSEDEEITQSEGIRMQQIQKPKGDVSRPGRGGYNLSKALGWNQKTYDSVLYVVTKLAKEKLDTSKSFCGQSKKAVRHLSETVHKEFSFLKDYEKDWPVNDMLKTYLKNSSQIARNMKVRETAEEIGKIVKKAASSAKQ